MTPIQVARQIAFNLETLIWPTGTSEDLVFGEVIVTNLPAEDALRQLAGRGPFAIVQIAPANADSEKASLFKQRFNVLIVTDVFNDELGQGPITGANKQSKTQSEGRGIGDIEGPMLRELELMKRQNGINVSARSISMADVQYILNISAVGSRLYEVEALCTNTEFYEDAIRISGSVSSPNVTISWVNPGLRFDQTRMMLRVLPGSSSSFPPTSGTEVTLAGDFSTSATDTPAVGFHTYGIFVIYNLFNAAEQTVTPTGKFVTIEMT